MSRKPKRNRLSATLKIRLSPALKRRLDAEALRQEIPTGQLGRKILNHGLATKRAAS